MVSSRRARKETIVVKSVDHTNVGWWESEIKRRSNPWRNWVRLLAAIAIFLFIAAIAVVNVLFPKNVSGLCPTIIYVKDYLSAIAAVVALLFSLKVFSPITEWYTKPSQLYRPVAWVIIEELRQNNKIDDTTEQDLKNIASSRLGATEDKNFNQDAEEYLRRACCDLSTKARDAAATGTVSQAGQS